jgi:ATP-binding cassette subfamily B protein
MTTPSTTASDTHPISPTDISATDISATDTSTTRTTGPADSTPRTSSKRRAESTRRPGRDDTPSRAGRPGELRRIVALFSEHRTRLLFIAALIVASALISVASPFLLRHILDVSLPDRDTAAIALLAGGMVVIAVSTTALDVVQSRQSTLVGQSVMHRLRTAVYTHLQRLSLGFYTRTRTGEIQSRIAGDIGSMQATVTSTVTSVVSSGTTVIATLVAMLALDWKLTMVSLVLVPLFVLISRKVGGMRREIATTRQERMADLSSQVSESLSVSGILLTKTMGRSGELGDRFATTSADLADLELRSSMTGRWRQSSIGIIVSVLPAAIYLAAAFTVAGTTGPVSIGTLVAFTALQTQLFRPMVSLLRTGVDMQTSLAMFRRVFDYLDLPVEIDEPAIPASAPAGRGELRFENVSFQYPGTNEQTLTGIDLTIPAGAHVAVVGSTGSGKTTLGYLAARLYDPTAGRVLLDGSDIRTMGFQDLSSVVGIVSQEAYLLHASIADNLRFARPDATEAEIEAAARAAQIHDLIAALPQGYDTVVGERGYRFSGGEKQRLAIARMILRNPPVLVLDEATSALDTRTEAAVTAELAALADGRTTLTIAHRLSTVRDADLIVVMDRGRVVEQGSHHELMAVGGRYAALVGRDLPAGEPDPLTNESELIAA